jgi:hypothetical protein
LENPIKYLIITVITIILLIPIFFGVYIQFFFLGELDIFINPIYAVGLLGLLVLGKIFEIYFYNGNNLELMRKHDVTNALINNNNRVVKWIFFPLTMLMEELIFRYYSIGLLKTSLRIEELNVILISSLIFSLYHIHTWFSFKNRTLLFINLIYPFLMGLYLGYIFLNLGIIPCIIIHYCLAFFLYYNISRKYFRKNKIKSL